MAKNPRPGFATQKQIAYLLRLLDRAKRSVSPDEYLVIQEMTQTDIRRATTIAEQLAAKAEFRTLPPWVKP